MCPEPSKGEGTPERACARKFPPPLRGSSPILFSLFRIGVGTAHWVAPPLPPNRTCRSPASGSPVGGLLCLSRLTKARPGIGQAEEPVRGKEGTGPAPTVLDGRPGAFLAEPFAQHRAQTAANVGVHLWH